MSAMDAFRAVQDGLFKEVCAPSYGRQDVGYSPGGPQDRFSMRIGNLLLGNDEYAPSLEIVFPPVLEFRRHCFFVLVGAHCRGATLRKVASGAGAVEDVPHGRVGLAAAGDRLDFGEKDRGFRIYLCVAPAASGAAQAPGAPLHRVRGAFGDISTWHDPGQNIRVIEGPEYSCLPDPDAFLNGAWSTTSQMSDMGVGLHGDGDATFATVSLSMVSSPVNDGTVQLTPSGLIVLMRSRATIGGYPRVLNVIGPDVDMLAQYGPGQLVRFRKVSASEAAAVAARQDGDIARFRARCSQRFQAGAGTGLRETGGRCRGMGDNGELGTGI
jgi:allophanate hydrolase subunit 2